jgi:hypothetical protein
MEIMRWAEAEEVPGQGGAVALVFARPTELQSLYHYLPRLGAGLSTGFLPRSPQPASLASDKAILSPRGQRGA